MSHACPSFHSSRPLTARMPFEHLVPMKFEDWGFFDRQRSVFSSMFKDVGDEWKEFDRELEKIRSEMFQLKVSARERQLTLAFQRVRGG